MGCQPAPGWWYRTHSGYIAPTVPQHKVGVQRCRGPVVFAQVAADIPLVATDIPFTRNARIQVTRMTFESNLTRLEQIVVRLETERLDLSASLSLFEEGVDLLRKASEELNEAETRVKELVERADGVLELRDFGG